MNAKAKKVTRNEMILSYYSLVCSIANKLARRLPDTVDVQELISVGMIGLIESYDRFDQVIEKSNPEFWTTPFENAINVVLAPARMARI